MCSLVRFISDRADRISRKVIVALFMLAFIGILYQVFSRYVLQNIASANFPWMEEAVRYLFIWIVFLGIAVVYKVRGHAQVEIMNQYLPAKMQRFLQILVEIINALFFLLLLFKGFAMLSITNGQLSPSLHLNMAWMYLSMLVCALICLVHSVHFLLNGQADERTPMLENYDSEDNAESEEAVNQ